MHRRAQANRAVFDTRWMAGLTAFCWCVWITPAGDAQTTSITSSGLSTQVQFNASTEVIDGTTFTRHDITGGTRSAGATGTNLFHSFGDFSVGSNHIANFLNGDGLPTNNILSRVTGGNPSSIFGMLRTTGFGAANLYLFNPSGMLFGPNASLDIAGSVHFSTASYLNVGGGRFDLGTSGPQVEVLTSAPVTAFGFLGPTAAGITIDQAVLQVPEGQTLSVVGGGDVTLTGGALVAQGGRIDVASVASAGEVVPNLPGDPAALAVGTFTGLGVVRLADGAQLDASGASPGGMVLIRGGQLVLAEGAMVNTGTRAGNPAVAGTIDVQTTDSVIMASADTVEAGLFSRAQGSGDGGTITVATETLEVGEGGRISALALGDADGQGTNGTVILDEVTTVTLSGGFIDGVSTGEITLDGSIGMSGAMAIPKVNDIFTIDAGMGDIRGNNLFFSFNRFRLLFGETARFTGPGPVANIIPRLTGGEPMVIDGTLHVDIPGANLYALAPHGVLFGAQGSLNISGSAHLSTANYLRFGDDARVFGNLTGVTTLTDSTPVAYGFDGAAPGGITARANLVGGHARAAVPDNETLTLVGGDIKVIGNGESEVLSAPGGQINFASIASNGEVIPNAPGQAPALQVDSFSSLGQITLSGRESGVLVQARGAGGGTVIVRGNSLTLRSAEISATTEGPPTGPLDGAPGAGIDVDVRGEILIRDASFLRANVQPEVAEGIGSGGIRLIADSIELNDGSGLSSVVLPKSTGGGSGNINIIANNVLIRDGAGVETGTESSANAGDIFVKAKNLELRGGVVFTLSTNATGEGGSISIEAETVLLSNPTLGGPFTAITAQTSGGPGRGGNVTVLADNLVILGGGNTNISSQTFGPGQGGNLDLQITEELFATGSAANPFNVGFFANAFSTGNAGDLSVAAGALRLVDHVGIQASAFFGASGKAGNVEVDVHAGPLELISGGRMGASALFGTGAGGTLEVTARDITISGISDSLAPFTTDFTGFSTATNAGVGGTMRVTADSILVTNKGQITSLSIGGGNAGDVIINLDSGSLDVTNGGVIISSAFGAGNGGTIDITAGTVTVSGTGPFVNLSNSGISGIASQSGLNGGNAGGVVIKAENLKVLDGAAITTDTFGPGTGGKIDIEATNKVLVTGLDTELEANLIAAGADPSSARANISAASGEILPVGPFGSAGNITVSAPAVEVRDQGLIRTSTTTDGDAGSIAFKARTFNASGDAIISSSSSGAGNAGSVGIEGLVSPAAVVNLTNSAVLTRAEGEGRGGSINVEARSLNVSDTTISASVTDVPEGDDPASGLSNITLTASDVQMTGGRVEAETRGTRAGGDITMNVGIVGLQNSTEISSSSTGDATGTAGNVTIQGLGGEGTKASVVAMSESSKITTEAGQASGGSITIQADDRVTLTDSTISTSVFGPEGTSGGNISIDPQFVIFKNSQVIAQAFEGRGGNIQITAWVFLADPNSIVDASSQFGLSGTVTIQSPLSNLSGALAPMPEAPLQAAALLRAACAARMQGGETSSFVQRGKGGLPSEPGGWVASPMVASPAPAPPSASEKPAEGNGLSVAASGSDSTVKIREMGHLGSLTRLLHPDRTLVCSL